MSNFYKATREGFDGKQIRKPGDVFPFDGPRGSWMVPCNEGGKTTETVEKQRETRHGSNQPKNHSREELREECRKRGINFKATLGAADLARLIQEHDAKGEPAAPGGDGNEGGDQDPGAGEGSLGAGEGAGTGNQDVI